MALTHGLFQLGESRLRCIAWADIVITFWPENKSSCNGTFRPIL